MLDQWQAAVVKPEIPRNEETDRGQRAECSGNRALQAYAHHASQHREQVTPIYMASGFTFDSAEQARANTGWDLKVASDLKTTPAPSAEELRILREELDPQGIYLKGGA